MRIQKLSHATYQHQYHLVCGTKYRRKWLKEYIKPYLREFMYQLENHYPTVKILALNTDEDHVHLQIEIPPNIAVAKVVQLLKQNSSREIRKKYAYIRRMYLEDSVWAVGYYSSTVGLNEEKIRKYIEHQGQEELPQEVSFGSS